MKHRNLSQEMLKLIACASMLIDHIGYSFFPENPIFRIIGRLAFPIYCFLLVEGARHTKDPRKYGLRLAVAALLSEIPFDLCIFGRLSWESQNVMLTLLLGFLGIQAMTRFSGKEKLLTFVFPLVAKALQTDYGAMGVFMILMIYRCFYEDAPDGYHESPLFAMLLAVLFFIASLWQLDSYPIQLFSAFAAVPIFFYNGKKVTRSKVLQWAFYLFYPIHLLILWSLRKFLLF